MLILALWKQTFYNLNYIYIFISYLQQHKIGFHYRGKSVLSWKVIVFTYWIKNTNIVWKNSRFINDSASNVFTHSRNLMLKFLTYYSGSGCINTRKDFSQDSPSKDEESNCLFQNIRDQCHLNCHNVLQCKLKM